MSNIPFFTTAQKKAEDAPKPDTEKTEIGKVVISDDAYAICVFLQKLINQMEKNK